MALTEPLDLLTGFPGWCTDFDLMARQEQSRHASGRTRTKDFGSPIWRASYQTRTLSANELDHWRARIGQAQNSQMTFRGYPLSRCRPIEHPGAAALPAGTLFAIGDDDKTVRVSGLVGVSLSIGDMIQIGASNLHRLVEPASGNPTGMFTIEPHIWPGTVTGQPVVIARPSCMMTVAPGSMSATADPRTGRGSISFSAIEAR
jgi:hypothetical protein